MTAKQKEIWKNRIREFYIELGNMRCFIANAIWTLNQVESSTNLTEEIGIFARDFPKFEHLGPQADWFKGTIRKVCSGEMEPREASTMMSASYQEIMELMGCFDRDELFSYVEHVPMTPVSNK